MIEYVATVIDRAVQNAVATGRTGGREGFHLRAALAVRLFRELRQEGRLPGSGL